MIFSHPSPFHHHYLTWRFLLALLLALLLFFLLASPARGQVMIDASQLHGQLPDWVDQAYSKPPAEEPGYVVVEPPPRPCQRIWVPTITRTVIEEVWVPDRYEWRFVEMVEGDRIVCRRVMMLVEAGHLERRCRQIVIVAGHWETRFPD